MNRSRYVQYCLAVMLSALAATIALAGPDPVPITADQAFDAVATGVDPVSGVKYGVGKVVIIDVRSPAEYQFQGTAGKVDTIELKSAPGPFVPDLGKAYLTQDGKYLEYKFGGKKKKTRTDQIAKLVTSPIAVNVPCATWNQATTKMDPTPERFVQGIEALADKGVQVIISMCNSGGRSTLCVAKFVSEGLASRFKAFYEIDRPGDQYLNPEHKIHLAGLGGFQGSVYGGVYNGYAGFPSRQTAKQAVQGWKQGAPVGPSVSWKDSGLPIFVPESSCNLPEAPRTP